ncbi:hypothetical protein AX769_00700 [Frondihabitans sp. PAMC 28766]|uniref:helix-turn-helix domain-containing protein n=1 Tax=Frondihabitans sp. PAMC 28766 TaxID=1795630 RepID=UPI00078E250A|nr:helix-turn-helix domain-containing protein [Frondihabitans sp. PAMC 28766]AMM18926.1 hypothetical protein AX769_00700 [Frondihabitans sp. PAMC 28766]
MHLESFSTSSVRESTRVALWEDYNARALVGLECHLLTGGALDATETNLDAGALQFAHVTASPHIVERSRQRISRSPADGVALYFTQRGESFFYSADGVLVQHPGSVLICDVSEPFVRGFAQGLEEFAVRIPRAVFDDLAGGMPLKKPVASRFSVGGQAPAAQLDRLLRTTLLSRGPGDRPCAALGAEEAERRALDLLRQILRPDRVDRLAEIRRTASRFIDLNLRDPQLSVATTAGACGVSDRQLTRAFAVVATSPARAILLRRLGLAHSILAGERPGPRAIGDVARWCGFASHAHFSRVFRDHFDRTPESVRDEATTRPV